METLILAAADFELKPLREKLGAPSSRATFLTFGIGALAAARNSCVLAQTCKNKNVVIVGTCGVFCPDPFDAPSLVTTNKIIWVPTSERFGLGYTIASTCPPIELTKSPTWTKSLQTKTVICSPTISLDAGQTATDIPLADCVENVELYSVASDVQSTCNSLAVILATTNSIGKSAHAEWKKNNLAASELYTNFILEKLYAF